MSDLNPQTSDALRACMGREIVLDLASSYVCIGTLVGEDHRYLTLKNADMHDLRDTTSTRELYVLDCRRHGVSWNRRKVLIRREEIVGLSLLEDIRV